MSCERANQCKSEKKGRRRGGKCSGCLYEWVVEKRLKNCKEPAMEGIYNKIIEDCWKASQEGSYGGRFRLDKILKTYCLT